ncbi:MAG: hypothetical protein ACOX2F_10510 [bacterium]
MKSFKRILTFAGIAILFIFSSCTSSDDFECITAFDCPDGWLCVDGFCVDPSAGSDSSDADIEEHVSNNKEKEEDGNDSSETEETPDITDDFEKPDESVNDEFLSDFDDEVIDIESHDEDIVASTCGNGDVEGEEECDFGKKDNDGSYGGCNSDCTWADNCGDGEINGPEGAEECDLGIKNGILKCEYGEKSCKVCDEECKEHGGETAYCGDGVVNGAESCDDGEKNGQYGFCNKECSSINKCGDSIVQDGEKCDGNSSTCKEVLGGQFTSKKVECKESCDGWITDECDCEDGYHREDEAVCVNLFVAFC